MDIVTVFSDANAFSMYTFTHFNYNLDTVK